MPLIDFCGAGLKTCARRPRRAACALAETDAAGFRRPAQAGTPARHEAAIIFKTSMKRILLTASAAALLAACLIGFYLTRDTGSAAPQLAKKAEQPLIDTRLLDTAHQLAGAAETPQEQALA